MTTNEIHKAFTHPPFAICDNEGEILDLGTELALLSEDIHLISELAYQNLTWKLLNEFQYADKDFKKKKSNYLGRSFKIKIPENVKKGETGRSRFEEMFRTYLFDQLKSWDSRINTHNGDNESYTSQGYKRTINNSKPIKLDPKMPLSSSDSQYSTIEIDSETIVLKMIINGEWRYLLFNFDTKRFHDAKKITKPDITLDEHGYPVFNFTAVYDYIYTEFSTDYIIAVDVGLTHYVTASVIRTSDSNIVDSTVTNLSADVHTLENKIKNANTQVASLQKSQRKDEASLHRKSNSRRKRELAILAGRELAALSAQWGNAIIVFEDLSWVSNTMQNGRWNRGALVKWTEHFVSLNGGRITKVNSAYTSRNCHKCDNPVKISNHHDVYCANCIEWFDRDYNATGNIGKRFILSGTHRKYVSTRRKARKSTRVQVNRVSNRRVKNHKPVRVRDKLSVTPSRAKQVRKNTIINKKGLEVKAIRIGSSNNTGIEDNTKKLVSIMTVKSNHSRRFARKNSYNHNKLYSLS